MIKRIINLVCSRMLGAYCIAGIDVDDHSWIRPIRTAGNPLYYRDIRINDRRINMYDCVEFDFEKKLNNAPHSEDYKINPGTYPKHIKTYSITSINEICNEIDESKKITKDIQDYLKENKRSLILIKPDEKLGIGLYNPFDESYKPSIKFKLNKLYYSYNCTDLKWRNLGMQKSGKDQMKKILNDNEIFFSIGLSRLYREDYWPFIIGVHSFPDY